MQERNALFRELTGLGFYERRATVTEAEVTISPTDVRIDVRAKFSLQRMLKQGGAAAQDAERMIAAINTSQLAGIDGDNTLRAVQTARQLGTQRWLLIPQGKDAELIRVPAGPPSIVFRDGIETNKGRFDTALRTAWRSFTHVIVSVPPTNQSTPTLRNGAQGPYVVLLQRRLNMHGANLVEDGSWGMKTGSAVASFQKRHKLAEANVVSRPTWNALQKTPTLNPSLIHNEGSTLATQSAANPFSVFVITGGIGVLDQDIADLLFDLHRKNKPSTMAHQVAVFAHHELANGNLVGIVRFNNSDKLKNRLASEHHPTIDVDSRRATKPENRPTGSTRSIYQGFYIRGYSFINDTLLDVISPPEPNPFGSCRPFDFTIKMPRSCFDFALLVLAHELTHFRNRVPTKMDGIDIVSSGQFVNPVLAASEPETVLVRKSFIHELGCRHVAWHVRIDLLHLKKRPSLLLGQFFRAALLLSLNFRSYSDPGKNAYMKKLSEEKQLADLSDTYRKQVALWMRSIDELIFHDDITSNEALKKRIEAEYLFVEKTNFKLPNVPADGLN